MTNKKKYQSAIDGIKGVTVVGKIDLEKVGTSVRPKKDSSAPSHKPFQAKKKRTVKRDIRIVNNSYRRIGGSNGRLLDRIRKEGVPVFCHHCNQQLDLFVKGEWGILPDNALTIDHIYPRDDIRAIAFPELRLVRFPSCHACNKRRDKEFQSYREDVLNRQEINIFSILTTGRVIGCIIRLPKELKFANNPNGIVR